MVTGRRIAASRRAWCALALLLAGLIVVGRSPSAAEKDLPIAAAESAGMSAKRLDRVKAFIQDYVDTNRIAGAVTLIASKGKVVHFEAQGWRDKEFTAAELWLDDAARKFATEEQRLRHVLRG